METRWLEFQHPASADRLHRGSHLRAATPRSEAGIPKMSVSAKSCPGPASRPDWRVRQGRWVYCVRHGPGIPRCDPRTPADRRRKIRQVVRHHDRGAAQKCNRILPGVRDAPFAQRGAWHVLPQPATDFETLDARNRTEADRLIAATVRAGQRGIRDQSRLHHQRDATRVAGASGRRSSPTSFHPSVWSRK